MRATDAAGRIRKGLQRRLYRLHPRNVLYAYHCNRSPDTPLFITIDNDVRARIWPGDTMIQIPIAGWPHGWLDSTQREAPKATDCTTWRRRRYCTR